MELSTAQRRKGLEQKIPDIGKTLQMVEYLKARQVCAHAFFPLPLLPFVCMNITSNACKDRVRAIGNDI